MNSLRTERVDSSLGGGRWSRFSWSSPHACGLWPDGAKLMCYGRMLKKSRPGISQRRKPKRRFASCSKNQEPERSPVYGLHSLFFISLTGSKGVAPRDKPYQISSCICINPLYFSPSGNFMPPASTAKADHATSLLQTAFQPPAGLARWGKKCRKKPLVLHGAGITYNRVNSDC